MIKIMPYRKLQIPAERARDNFRSQAKRAAAGPIKQSQATKDKRNATKKRLRDEKKKAGQSVETRNLPGLIGK